MKLICKKCGSTKLNVSTFVDYGCSNSTNFWHWLFKCPSCGYIGEDVDIASNDEHLNFPIRESERKYE